MTITSDALCCLFQAVADSAAAAEADPFEHAYPSAAMTWPYCDHHAITGRALPPSTLPPPNLNMPPADDPNTTGRIWWHRFELAVIRCGPPAPTNSTCVAGLYGDCTTSAGHSTIAGHYQAVDLEMNRLTTELLVRWCDCLVASVDGYPRHAPRWIETSAMTTQGRFTALEFTVGTRLG